MPVHPSMLKQSYTKVKLSLTPWETPQSQRHCKASALSRNVNGPANDRKENLIRRKNKANTYVAISIQLTLKGLPTPEFNISTAPTQFSDNLRGEN